MRPKPRHGVIAFVVFVAGVAVATTITGGRPPIDPDGLPLPMERLRCEGVTGADILWIKGTGFHSPERALGATLAGNTEAFDPSAFSKRYVRLGHGPNPGLGAEFTLVGPDAHRSFLAIAEWSDDGWVVHGFTRCLDVAPGGRHV